MLRLRHHSTGEALDLPPTRLHIHVHSGRERALVTADLLRRVAERARRRVTLSRSAQVRPSTDVGGLRLPEMGVALEEELPGGTLWVGSQQVAGHPCLIVPPERCPWDELAEGAGGDPLSVRLAILRQHYAAEDAMDGARVAEAARDLERWRTRMGRWATGPGRPMDRAYAARAEEALADDLDSPAALTVLEELATDPDVAPGAKLETVIHLDLLLGLDLVSGIGRA